MIVVARNYYIIHFYVHLFLRYAINDSNFYQNESIISYIKKKSYNPIDK